MHSSSCPICIYPHFSSWFSQAYVRPSPTKSVLGGLAAYTEDVVSLCQVGKCCVIYFRQVAMIPSLCLLDEYGRLKILLPTLPTSCSRIWLGDYRNGWSGKYISRMIMYRNNGQEPPQINYPHFVESLCSRDNQKLK